MSEPNKLQPLTLSLLNAVLALLKTVPKKQAMKVVYLAMMDLKNNEKQSRKKKSEVKDEEQS